MLWAFAKMSVSNDQMMLTVAEGTLRCQEQFGPQELANMAWAWATFAAAPTSVIGAISSQSMAKLHHFGPKDLANVAWAFQTLAHSDEELYRVIREASVVKMAGFNAQDMANTAWVLASQRCRELSLLNALAQQALLLFEFRPLNLAALAWGFGALKYLDETLMADLSAKSLPQILQGEFDPHSIASIAWCFATLAYHRSDVFEAINSCGVGSAVWQPQDVANVAWAFAVVEKREMSIMAEAAAYASQKLRFFRREELEMLLWSLAPQHFDLALQVFQEADRLGRLRPLGLSPLLAEAERRGLRGLCRELLSTSRACASFGRYAAGLAATGGDPWKPWSPGEDIPQSSKAMLALEYVLKHVKQGDAPEVLRALESFALEVLKPRRQWFKIAAGDKATVVEQALRKAPAGACLEIGTYVGYTAIRCALRRPNSPVVSIEVEPEHAVVAQCMAEHAGVNEQVRVWTGQSGDVLRSLPERYGSSSFAGSLRFGMVFMDQCGSRFWPDLAILIKQDMLLPGAIILADNVLKPGAPLFLWEVFHGQGGDAFTSHLISLEEFAMPGVEDCMVMARYNPSTSLAGAMLSIPSEVMALEFEASRIRTRAAKPGGVPFEDWSAHGERMKQALEDLDIKITEQHLSCEFAEAQ